MTDTALRIIATEPTWQPSREQADRVGCILAPLGRDVMLTFEDEIAFIDTGGNWEGVFCRACGANANAEGWWGEAMAAAAADHFNNLGVTAPCCHTATRLDDLDYKPPAGFARFVIELREPSVAPSAEVLRELDEVMDRPLRLIWFHI